MTLAIDGAASAAAALRTAGLSPAQVQTPPSPQPQAATVQPSPAAAPTISVSATEADGHTGAADALGQAASIADTAQGATGSVLQILQQLRQTASDATDAGLSSQDRSALNTDFQTLTTQLRKTVHGASAGGVNLIDGSAAPQVQVASDANGGQVALSAYDLTPGGPVVSLASDASIDTASAAASALSQVSGSLEATRGALANFTTQARQIGAHADFVATLGAATGASPPDSADGVRLQALQLRQSLSAYSGAIANTAPQSVLSLFRS